ncbi:MAG: hypothetical protein HZY76_13080 [Anaerolineae bacterium]|nr:MAG: hypothetical protein HZY76_13080 [Anaerolineae bacterium]
MDANPNQPGVQVSFGTFLDPGLSVRNTADNTAGTVRYAMTQLNPSVAKNGTGNLIVIKFRGKSAGSTALVLSEVALASRDAAEIPSTKQPGQVTVGSSAGNLPTTTPIPTQAPPTPVPTAMPTQAPTQVQPSVTATDLPTAVSTATAVPRTQRMYHRSLHRLWRQTPRPRMLWRRLRRLLQRPSNLLLL